MNNTRQNLQLSPSSLAMASLIKHPQLFRTNKFVFVKLNKF